MQIAAFLDLALPDAGEQAFALRGCLNVIHGVNRGLGSMPDTQSYRLAIAFPYWSEPGFKDGRMLSRGSTGPIVRIFGDMEALELVRESRVVCDLARIGAVKRQTIERTPSLIAKWEAFRRVNSAERSTPSAQRRRERRVAARRANTSEGPGLASASTGVRIPAAYVLLPLTSESTGQRIALPVARYVLPAEGQRVPERRFNSWGLALGGAATPQLEL